MLVRTVRRQIEQIVQSINARRNQTESGESDETKREGRLIEPMRRYYRQKHEQVLDPLMRTQRLQISERIARGRANVDRMFRLSAVRIGARIIVSALAEARGEPSGARGVIGRVAGALVDEIQRLRETLRKRVGRSRDENDAPALGALAAHRRDHAVVHGKIGEIGDAGVRQKVAILRSAAPTA